MPRGGRTGGRGAGRGAGTQEDSPQGSPRDDDGTSDPPVRPGRGAGRGIPDFKENPARKRAHAQESGAPKEPTAPFDAKEATEWMAARHKALVEEMERTRKDKDKGDMKTYNDLFPEKTAWSSARPIIPRNEGFEKMLGNALGQ